MIPDKIILWKERKDSRYQIIFSIKNTHNKIKTPIPEDGGFLFKDFKVLLGKTSCIFKVFIIFTVCSKNQCGRFINSFFVRFKSL